MSRHGTTYARLYLCMACCMHTGVACTNLLPMRIGTGERESKAAMFGRGEATNPVVRRKPDITNADDAGASARSFDNRRYVCFADAGAFEGV